jgi:SulP family sulfate permease
MKTFSSSHANNLDEQFVARIVPYFKTRLVPAGEEIYRQGDRADGLYLIESGVLRVTYTFADHVPDVVESCVAGTLSGELSALAGEPRNATVVAERQSVLWKLGIEDLSRLENDHPEDARLFIKLVLKSTLLFQ